MDLNPFLTPEVLLKLKCHSCKNYLSYFPIYISKNKENICGRCSEMLVNYVRNEMYETLAQFVKFPCRYKSEGCSDNFIPKDIPNHEEVCGFRKIKCPLSQFTSCTWEGARPLALHHCQSKHFDLILKDGAFTVDLSKAHQNGTLLEGDSSIFVVKQNFYSINKLMEISIMEYDVNAKEIPCKINFTTNGRSLTVSCTTTAFDKEKPLEIFLDCFQDSNSISPVVSVKIIFEKPSEDAPLEEKINEELLSQLKCSKCNNYCLPPVYENETKLLICSECDKPPTQNHGLFQTNIVGSIPKNRNYNLDKIALLLNYPCRYRPSGCSFVDKPMNMKNHLEFCAFGSHNCPLNEYIGCTWNGLGRDIMAHILESHAGLILNSLEISEVLANVPVCVKNEFLCGSIFDNGANSRRTATPSRKLTQPTNQGPKSYLLKFSGRLFLVNFGKTDQNYHWVVQMIGPFENKFMFELEIVDKNQGNSGLVIKKPCISLKKRDEVFSLNRCYFSGDQISPFVYNEKLTFKIDVYAK